MAAQDARIVILPPTAGGCAYCGDIHDQSEPHTLYSLTYQHKFRQQYGRYPTWADAMRHCPPAVRKRAIARLAAQGIVVEDDSGEETTEKE